MLQIVTLPSASTLLTGVEAWSQPVFTDFLPLTYFVVGIGLVFSVIVLVWGLFHFGHKN